MQTELLMRERLRHCVACPECCTRYLIGFSPYGNGSVMVSVQLASDEYSLWCSCRYPVVHSGWRISELKRYLVPREAYARGYGSREEIRMLGPSSPQKGRDCKFWES